MKKRKSRKVLILEKPNIEPSGEFLKVLERMEKGEENLFITGRAGTGKSTLLKYFQATTKKRSVVLAPTGVAAVNVNGQTIHSFFKFGITITPSRVRSIHGDENTMYKNLDMIIIDEISMVRADLFDCLEKSLRLNGPKPGEPFGGVQIIVFGDLYQLPPVVVDEEEKLISKYKSPYFFDSEAYEKANFSLVELEHVYRQSDEEFIRILDAIRVGAIDQEHINVLNQCVPSPSDNLSSNRIVKLVTTNQMAHAHNRRELRGLAGKEFKYNGMVVGEFPERNMPTEMELALKKGAQVMLLNNDPQGRWVNGDIASILEVTESSIKLLFGDGTYDEVGQYTWDMIKFTFNETSGQIEPEIVGSFTQYPIRLAWAVTIHKGQGKTFDNVLVNFGSGAFAPGQAYVALSRCRTLKGLLLELPVKDGDIFADERVNEYFHQIHDFGTYRSNVGKMF